MVFTKHETRITAFSGPLFPFFDGKLLRTSAERGDGEVHTSAYRPPFPAGLPANAKRTHAEKGERSGLR